MVNKCQLTCSTILFYRDWQNLQSTLIIFIVSLTNDDPKTHHNTFMDPKNLVIGHIHYVMLKFDLKV